MPLLRAVARHRSATDDGFRRVGWSLERRLPLLILALLACVVAGFSVAVYGEVRSSAISRATDRLERVARELTATAARTGQSRLTALRTLAADSTVVGAVLVRGRSPVLGPDRDAAVPLDLGRETAAMARVGAVLSAARAPSDSTSLGWELWTSDGVRRYRSRSPSAVRDSVVLAGVRDAMLDTDSVQRSPLYAVGGAVHMWTVVPIRAGGRTVGVLAERRRLNNSAGAEETIRQLTGEDVRVLFTSRGSADWASLRGTPTAAPFTQTVGADTAALVTGTDGKRRYVVQGQVPGTPWRIVLLQSEASVLRRPQELVRDLVGVGVVLLAFGTAGAWLLGRHVARPLRHVTDAASALAGGDYTQRVPVTGAAEVASLASRFNTMAERLGEAHAALAERNVALKRANDAKGQFLAVMSHELRTPLNAIGGYTELLQLGLRGPVTPEQIADLGRIRRSKDHLLAVIADILNFSRTEAGLLTLTLTRVPVADVFGDAVDLIGPAFHAKGVRLAVDSVPPHVVLWGDREKVQQVVLNLLSNALKFTEPPGEVALAFGVGADGVRLEVRDTGIGIPPDRLADIFEPFVQIDGSLTRRAGGTGLGLAIARTLTTAMHGRLTVESALGHGSRFSAVLPLPRSDAPATREGEGIGEATLSVD
jgi:signal transduction histidine kinase